ncbi:AzlD domain-containing protein [Erwinia persicina]|uniref:AzlD domain-containing protein n=1 Tax=Erwinia persicina TaxID=55211 RepID=UPI0017855676|nr:AzlD domain-containing protein [Erwinia persicina]MBD8163514.1 AzlD domain-containing protein [Erwinia persicina]
MADNTLLIGGIAVLALGTWLMRFAGAQLGSRMALSEDARRLLSDAATTLLFAVALASTFYEGTHFAGVARVTGVAVAVILAWRKIPLIAVILAAAAVTALLRFIGIP